MRPLATFDGDTFIDYRARRPTMELREGVNTRLVWADIELHVGRDADGHDVLLLSGPEPDSQWRRFADASSTLAVELGVRKMVALGAYPFATPHTRDPRLSSSSPSADVVASVAVPQELRRRAGRHGRRARARLHRQGHARRSASGRRCRTTSAR